MGSIFQKISPQQKLSQNKYKILDPHNHQDISRANFKFLNKISVTGHNQQQIVWQAQNIRNSKQKFLIKQIDKLILQDNNRVDSALKQLQLWLGVYKEKHFVQNFLADLLFVFHDYQYLYMVFSQIDGYPLDKVLKNHVFEYDQTKYAVAVMIQIIEYFHQKKYSLTELSPEHFIVEKSTGKIKLLQIFNPMPIDVPYNYNVITNASLYASPQVLTKNKVLAESDYYTLGTIMYEMLTQKNGILVEIQKNVEDYDSKKQIERYNIIDHQIIADQQILVRKYNLPQGWNPEAADFLVKLLVKNPLYRLGRYGSFQLQFHPFLQNYNWGKLDSIKKGITLKEAFFKQKNSKNVPQKMYQKNISLQERQRILKDPIFLKTFQNYKYRKDLSYLSPYNQIHDGQSSNSFHHLKIKKSQKYYDDNNDVNQQQIQQSDEQCIQQDQYQGMVYDFHEQQGLQSMDKSQQQFERPKSNKNNQSINNSGKKNFRQNTYGRGLLNIVQKNQR